jgi:hypothetical protein
MVISPKKNKTPFNMARKLLILLLTISLLLETGLTGAAFFARGMSMTKMGSALNADTNYPEFLIAWILLFVSLMCALALWQVIRKKAHAALCYVLGLWWISIGIGIYLGYGKMGNLLTDSLKGLLLVILTYWNNRPVPLSQKTNTSANRHTQ